MIKYAYYITARYKGKNRSESGYTTYLVSHEASEHDVRWTTKPRKIPSYTKEEAIQWVKDGRYGDISMNIDSYHFEVRQMILL